MIVEESEFIYILNDYHGTARNFPHFFKEAYYRLQKERAVTISAYLILKQFTGVSIPKLESFLGIAEEEEVGSSATVEEIKAAMVNTGAFVIKKGNI